MKRFAPILIALIALLAAPPARAEGYVTGTYEEMQWVLQWDSWLRGYPTQGMPACPPRRPQYQGCLGPLGACGSWYNWTIRDHDLEDLGGGLYQYYLDSQTDYRIAQMAELDPSLRWDWIDILAANRECVPGQYYFIRPFWHVYLDETQTVESVVATLTAYWESTL